MTHKELCSLAKKWLSRPISQRGHGCQVTLSECRSGWGGEMPDAIGFRATNSCLDTETVIIEAKLTRADFLADAKKPHRAVGQGMGLYRYFLCPEGLIQADELPSRWGLLWLTRKGSIKVVAGAVAQSKDCAALQAAAPSWRHERDTAREMWLLVRIMARISDPDAVKESINSAQREQARLVKICNDQAAEIRALKMPSAAALSAELAAGVSSRAIPR